MSLDEIQYPGSEQYSDQERAAPGKLPIEFSEEPLIRATNTAYIMFQLTDLQKQKAFLEDFGMIEVDHPGDRLYVRGYNTDPYIYEAVSGQRSRFLGAGFMVGKEEDLLKVSAETGRPIEEIQGPGGGKRVRLKDPDGFLVDLVFGRSLVEPLETRRDALPTNLPNQKNRINQGQREPLAPSPIERFGHYVLMVSDFAVSWQWYRKHLGIIPTDVLCTASGTPVLAFNRLDKGDEPADHHSVVLSAGMEPAYMHSAYETCDQDSIGQGQQFLKMRKWKHFWGIGRHILGSQIFDYWLDPHGFEVEHYADGDVFDSNYPTQYHLFDRGGLWAWGNDVPDAMRLKPSLKTLVALVTGGKEKRGVLLEMKKAMDRVPRPWLK